RGAGRDRRDDLARRGAGGADRRNLLPRAGADQDRCAEGPAGQCASDRPGHGRRRRPDRREADGAPISDDPDHPPQRDRLPRVREGGPDPCGLDVRARPSAAAQGAGTALAPALAAASRKVHIGPSLRRARRHDTLPTRAKGNFMDIQANDLFTRRKLIIGLALGSVAAAAAAAGIGFSWLSTGSKNNASWWDRTFVSLRNGTAADWLKIVGESFTFEGEGGPSLWKVTQ